MERRINLDNQEVYESILPVNKTQILNNKTLVERIKELEVLVEQLATGLNKQQSEFVTLKTFIGFNEKN